MAGKVILEVTKGENLGKRYEYDRPFLAFVGRQEDCAIVIPENTVSRYHCLLDINPPRVKLQDFGSLNGTFINGEKIGQRKRDQSPKDVEDEVHREYPVHDGDVIRLGKRCEIKCTVEQEIKELDEMQDSLVNGSEEDSSYNSVSQGEQKVCVICGRMFPPSSPDDTLCPECRQDGEKLVGAILAAMLGGEKQEDADTPSPVKGYEKVESLGKGGMGEVWKVRNEATGEYFALKTMLPGYRADEQSKKMFLREAKLSEFLKHRNVVRTWKTGCTDGVFYILMELCEGGNVHDRIKQNGGRLPLNLATYIILQALSGLSYVHHVDVQAEIRKHGLFGGVRTVNAQGIVHRDFKPGNIFLSDHSDHPVALVADFGMAKAFQTAGLSTISGPRDTKGTVPFMPRQQAMNYRYAKPEVDVWAAAASYYYMLTGEVPKNLSTRGNLWQAIVSEKPVPIRERDASIPELLARVIDHALIEVPEIGCKSADVLRDDIIRAIPQETRDYCRDIL